MNSFFFFSSKIFEIKKYIIIIIIIIIIIYHCHYHYCYIIIIIIIIIIIPFDAKKYICTKSVRLVGTII